MKHASPVATMLLLISIPLLLDPPEGDACGPFLPEAQFGFVYNPGPRFLHGELGIVQPGSGLSLPFGRAAQRG